MKKKTKDEEMTMREYLDLQRKITQRYEFKEYLKENFLAAVSTVTAIIALLVSIAALIVAIVK